MTTKTTEAEFAIQRIYTKDISFEAPNAPQIFQQEWKPDLKLDLQSNSHEIDKNIYEVVVSVTATVNSNDKLAFLVEIKQAGIFVLKNFPDGQMGPLLGSACPTIIFPYLREVISDVVVRGGFPQLCLAPINFDALYAQQQQKNAEHAKEKEDAQH